MRFTSLVAAKIYRALARRLTNGAVIGPATARSFPTTGIHYSGRHVRCRNRLRLRIITSRKNDAGGSIPASRRRLLVNRDRDGVNDVQVENRLSPASVSQTKADAMPLLATRAALRVRANVELKSAMFRWIKKRSSRRSCRYRRNQTRQRTAAGAFHDRRTRIRLAGAVGVARYAVRTGRSCSRTMAGSLASRCRCTDLDRPAVEFGGRNFFQRRTLA